MGTGEELPEVPAPHPGAPGRRARHPALPPRPRPKPFVRERCAALLKIADGQAPYAVAHSGLLRPRDPDSVYAWLGHYQEAGLPGLFAHQHGGNRRGVFSRDQQRRQQLQERLRQGPGEEARAQAAATPQGPPPSHWTLQTIRATFDWLGDFTLSGVWRQLQR